MLRKPNSKYKKKYLSGKTNGRRAIKCVILWIFFLTFSKTSFRNIIRVSNSLDPDQARPFVGPDLGPNCLQRLSADDSGLAGKELNPTVFESMC